MTIRNLLNLRPKKNPEVIIVKKEILKPRSFRFQVLRVVTVICFVVASIWGISQAAEAVRNLRPHELNKAFSTVGYIKTIDEDTFILNPAKGEDPSVEYEYVFNLDDIKLIVTNTSDPLSVTDLQVGDKVIVLGIENSSGIIAKKIVSFSDRYADTENGMKYFEPELNFEMATSTATTTDILATTSEDVITATNTDAITVDENVDSTGEGIGGPGGDSEGLISNIVDVVKDVVEGISDIVDNTIEQITNPDEAATSTEETSEPVITPEPTQITPDEATTLNESTNEGPDLSEPVPELEPAPEVAPELQTTEPLTQ